MKNKILKAIEQHKMTEKTDRLLVALSGGADSVCLLHCLWGLKEALGVHVEALHLNHNLRGEESARDEAFVRALCEKWGVRLTVESLDVSTLAKASGESVELCARRLRYDFFAREAEGKPARVATGHNQDDNAETVLLNLIRGTSLRGLCGIPPVRESVIRPLLFCSRAEVEAYCETHHLDYVTDSTNASDGYTRNRIRHGIMPLLLAENPRFSERTASMAQALRHDADFLDRLAKEARAGLSLPGGFSRAGFLSLDPALRSRVLLGILRGAGLSPGRDTARRLLALIGAGRGEEELSRERTFVCGPECFFLRETREPRPYFELALTEKTLHAGGIVPVYPGKTAVIEVNIPPNIENAQKIQKKGLTYCLDCDRIDKIITLRQKLPGDKLRLPGRGHTKTLKNLFWEDGVPPDERARRVVLADKEGVLLVEGIGVCERAAVTPGTARILTVVFLEDGNECGYLKGFD